MAPAGIEPNQLNGDAPIASSGVDGREEAGTADETVAVVAERDAVPDRVRPTRS